MKGFKLGMLSAAVRGAIVASSLFVVVPAQADVSVDELKSLYGSELQVLGEVQRIDLSKGILVVAGQHIAISKETVFSIDRVAVADSASAFRTIQNGDVVAVSGPLDRAAVSIDQLKGAYVPGATTVFVKGKISTLEKIDWFRKNR